MGYCISLEEGSIEIKKENMKNVISVLKSYLENNTLRWIDGNWDEDDGLEDIWHDLRYDLIKKDDYYEIIDFSGEKYGDDNKIFDMIAPYCEDGYLQFCGEDGEHFRFIIKDGKFKEKYADLSWE